MSISARNQPARIVPLAASQFRRPPIWLVLLLVVAGSGLLALPVLWFSQRDLRGRTADQRLEALRENLDSIGALPPLANGNLADPVPDQAMAALPGGNLSIPLQAVDRLADSAPVPVSLPLEGRLTPDDGSFLLYYDLLYEDQALYYGREIELSGLVYRDAGLADGEFMIGRNLIWHSEDDSYFIGFLAFGLPQSLPDGESFRIHGWLEPRPYSDPERQVTFTVPAIRVDRAWPDRAFAMDLFRSEGF